MITIAKENSIKIYWSAIATGVIMVIATQSLFNLLGLGLMTIPSMDSVKHMSLFTTSWVIMTTIVTMFFGGWLSGMCSVVYQKFYGAVHGLIVWAIAMLLTFMLMASAAGMLVNSSLSLLSQGLSLAGKEAFSSAEGVASQAGQLVKPVLEPLLDNAVEQAKEAVEAVSFPSNPDDPAATGKNKQQLTRFVSQLFAANTGDDIETVRQKLNTFLLKNTNLSQSQIDETISDWQQTYADLKEQTNQKVAQTKQKAIETANQASGMVGKLALLFFSVLLTGAIAASLGGIWATKTQTP